MNEPLKIKVSSTGLAEWLTSNRVGNPYDARTPVIGLAFQEGFTRWPIIEDFPSPPHSEQGKVKG